MATYKIEVVGYDRYKDLDRGRIYNGWHGKTLVPAYVFRGRGVWTIVSLSKDGDMQNWIFKRFGFHTVRGSTGRGGIRAAKEIIQKLKENVEVAFTPDGPRGPTEVVQMGAVLMAKKSGSLLIPAAVSANRRWVLKTWDSYMVPKPFARCIFKLGEGIEVPEHASSDEMEAARLELERSLKALQAEVDAQMGHSPPSG